jgi:hypothetical protein
MFEHGPSAEIALPRAPFRHPDRRRVKPEMCDQSNDDGCVPASARRVCWYFPAMGISTSRACWMMRHDRHT